MWRFLMDACSIESWFGRNFAGGIGSMRAGSSDHAAANNLRRRQGYPMSDACPTRESMSIEEATISNMWEIAAIVGAWL
jgi:hypothetical protein